MVRERLNDQAFVRMNVELTPYPRLGEPEDVASTIGFLCSPGGSFINGQVIARRRGLELHQVPVARADIDLDRSGRGIIWRWPTPAANPGPGMPPRTTGWSASNVS